MQTFFSNVSLVDLLLKIRALRPQRSNCTNFISSLQNSTVLHNFCVSKHQRYLDTTVTLHWPTTQPDMHTKIALRLQSSSHLGDTNGMIDTNVSRANCTADLHRSDRALYPSNHLACWQELFLVCMNGSSYSSKQDVSVFHMLSGWHADPS